MNKPLTTRAFTLIEVLVVTAVISLLASVVNAQLLEARKEAQDKAKIEEAQQVNNALAIHRNKTDSVPQAASLSSYVAHNEQSSEYQTAMGELVTSSSIPEIPRSNNGQDYYYIVDESGNGVFGAVLRSDSSIANNGGCYFTDPDVGCSGSGDSYSTEYVRDNLVSVGDSCDGGCSDSGVLGLIMLETNTTYTVNFGGLGGVIKVAPNGYMGNIEFGVLSSNNTLYTKNNTTTEFNCSLVSGFGIHCSSSSYNELNIYVYDYNPDTFAATIYYEDELGVVSN